MTPGQAVRNKRLQSGRAWPDLFIAEPKWPSKGLMNNPDYTCGLFIEIKKEGTKIFLKDGETLVADEHVREQAETLKKLRDRGYKAVFGIGFEECKKIIDEYLSSRV